MPAVIAFLVALLAIAFVIAFGANKLLEVFGFDIDVPGGYITSTLIIGALLYAPAVIISVIETRRAKHEDPDSFMAQDTRFLSQTAKRMGVAAKETHQMADEAQRDALKPSGQEWTLKAIEDRLMHDDLELQPSSPAAVEAVTSFLTRVWDGTSGAPVEQLAGSLSEQYAKRLAAVNVRCLNEAEQLTFRALDGNLVHFNGQEPQASREYRVQRVVETFRSGMGIAKESGSSHRSDIWQADDLVLGGQLRKLLAWADADPDPARLARLMFGVTVVAGGWLSSPERRTLE